jgi:hypothetical protein
MAFDKRYLRGRPLRTMAEFESHRTEPLPAEKIVIDEQQRQINDEQVSRSLGNIAVALRDLEYCLVDGLQCLQAIKRLLHCHRSQRRSRRDARRNRRRLQLE